MKYAHREQNHKPQSLFKSYYFYVLTLEFTTYNQEPKLHVENVEAKGDTFGFKAKSMTFYTDKKREYTGNVFLKLIL